MTLEDNLKKVVQSVHSALHEFLESMCPLPIRDGEAQYQTGIETQKNHFEMVGVISISGQCKGSISVHLVKGLAENVAKTLLGLDTIENQADVFDTVGEMANLVGGGGKTKASSAGLDFDISCPTVVRGDPYAVVEPVRGSSYALLHYQVDSTPFMVMVYLVS